MELLGLRLDVYRYAGGGDCSLGGITSNHNTVTLVGIVPANGKTPAPLPRHSRVFSPSEDAPAVVLVRRVNFYPYLAPYSESGVYPYGMFGGNFAYASDSRFIAMSPSGGPLAVHDRFE